MTYDILTTPVFSVERADGARTKLTLPGLLAELSSQSVVSLTRVAAHQRQTVFRFLVQLTAIALAKAEYSATSALPTDETSWLELLRSLTEEYKNNEPWMLIGEDLSKPAFLQPAILTADGIAAYKKAIETPDALDVLITAKNHDVKGARQHPDDPELWLYALLSLQTTQGFLGVGNQGISRMNGGFGSRCFISRAPSLGVADRFIRDVRMLLHWRDTIVETQEYQAHNGLALVWLTPWDSDTQIPLGTLDPYFIEICRRIRLTQNDAGVITAFFKTSAQPRINAKEQKGNLGDPWVPINASQTALTISGEGYSTRLKCDILFEQESISRQPLALQHIAGIDGEAPMWYIGSVLVRGQGKTEGLHDFALLVPSKFMRSKTDAARAGKRAQSMLSDANTARLKTLRPALLTLIQGARENLVFDDNRDQAWRDQFSKRVDDVFFTELWRYADAESDDEKATAEAQWHQRLGSIGLTVLRDMIRGISLPDARKQKAEVKAEFVYRNAFKKLFNVYPSQLEENAA